MIHATWRSFRGLWVIGVHEDMDPQEDDIVLLDKKGDASGLLRLLGAQVGRSGPILMFSPGLTQKAEKAYMKWAESVDLALELSGPSSSTTRVGRLQRAHEASRKKKLTLQEYVDGVSHGPYCTAFTVQASGEVVCCGESRGHRTAHAFVRCIGLWPKGETAQASTPDPDPLNEDPNDVVPF